MSTLPDVLDERGRLKSDLWVDQPDALACLPARAVAAGLDAHATAEVGRFIEQGYALLDLPIPTALFGQIDREIDRLWRTRPKDVAWGGVFDGLVGDFSLADIPVQFARDEPKQWRFASAHSHCPGMQELYFLPELHRFVSFIFGQPCVATQTLYFEYGSLQGQHRDTSVVSFDPLSHLAAAWIALEDISPDSGPLEYFPGSHRIENFRFADGSILWDTKHGPDSMTRMNTGIRGACAAHGLSARTFCPRRGQALIWHHSLSHGGALAVNPNLTRKSLVIHYSTLATCKKRFQGLHFKPESVEEYFERVEETDRIETRSGCHGFASAIAGWHEQPQRPSRRSRAVPKLELMKTFRPPRGSVDLPGFRTGRDLCGRVDSSQLFDGHFVFSGWAVDRRSMAPAENIVLTIDDKPVYVGVANQYRADVGESFGSMALTYSGFYAITEVPLPLVDARVFAVANDGAFAELDCHDGFPGPGRGAGSQ